jgi:uncharacterized protein YxjI
VFRAHNPSDAADAERMKSNLLSVGTGVRDTYGIKIVPDQDDALILAVTVRIDQMVRS